MCESCKSFDKFCNTYPYKKVHFGILQNSNIMKYMKTTIYQAILTIAVIVSISSCINSDSKDTKSVAVELNKAKFGKISSENDAVFLVNAAEINMKGINLGKLAQQKGTMNHLKELGKMMNEEHTKSLADLTEMAKTKNISLPTSQTENGLEIYKKLSEKSVINFDKAYSDIIVDEHKSAIELFEKASIDCTDPDIKAWAAASLPTLKIHLDHSLMCQKECEKM